MSRNDRGTLRRSRRETMPAAETPAAGNDGGRLKRGRPARGTEERAGVSPGARDFN
jgi:hypothetical protein